MKLFARVLLIVVLLAQLGCSARKSQFIYSSINLGVTKDEILKQYGEPFSSSIDVVGGKDTVEVFCYKELVNVSYETFVLNTYFYFENDILVKREQKSENPPSSMKVKD